jgi:restriction endonuclease
MCSQRVVQRPAVFQRLRHHCENLKAEQLERSEAVKAHANLPNWFKVPTPLDTLNPDWAVVVEASGEERLYFVVETKGSLFVDDLRGIESAKSRTARRISKICNRH